MTTARTSAVSDLERRPLILRLYPDSALRRKCHAVKRWDQRTASLARDMLELMHAHRGIGLAAPQVGILQRVIVADIGRGPIALTNPKVIGATGLDTMAEGCLSLPNVQVEVQRQTRIEVKARDPLNRPVHFEARDLLARVIQHEIDHLDGVLICDYQVPDIVKQEVTRNVF